MIGMPLSALALVTLLTLYFYHLSDFFAINLRLIDWNLFSIMLALIGVVLANLVHELPLFFFFGLIAYNYACFYMRDGIVPKDDYGHMQKEMIVRKLEPATFWFQVSLNAAIGIALLVLLQLAL